MTINNFAGECQRRPIVNSALPPLHSLTHALIHCSSCTYMCTDLTQLEQHQSQSPWCQGLTRVHSPRPQYQAQQRGSRHDSIHPTQSPSGWVNIPGRRNTRLPSPSPSAASDSEGACYVTRPSLVSLSPHGSRRNSHIAVRASKRHRRQPPAPLATENNKKAKKTEKEKLNRSNQAAVLFRKEDSAEHYIGWSKQEQSGGNGNSAGLSANKINILRALEAVSNHAIHELYCQAIKEGNLDEFQAKYQAIADAACKDDYRPFHGTFLEMAPGEIPCSHEDTKSKECSVHGHPDWRECRKTRAGNRFTYHEDAYIASLGMTKQQARHGSRAAMPAIYDRPQMLPHRQARK